MNGRDEFEKAAKEFCVNDSWARPDECGYDRDRRHFEAGAQFGFSYRNAEVKRLNRIILKELTENDELGCEFTYVNALREENAKLKQLISHMDKIMTSIASDHCDDPLSACSKFYATEVIGDDDGNSIALVDKTAKLRAAVRGALGWFALWNNEMDQSKWPKFVMKCEEALKQGDEG